MEHTEAEYLQAFIEAATWALGFGLSAVVASIIYRIAKGIGRNSGDV